MEGHRACEYCDMSSGGLEVAKLLEFQLQHHSFQRNPRADLLQNGLVGSLCSPRDDFTHENQVQSLEQERGDWVEGRKPRCLDGINISNHPPSRPGSLIRKSYHTMAMISREHVPVDQA